MTGAAREGWRRALHLASGSLGLLALALPRPAVGPLLLALLVLALGLEGYRLRAPRAGTVLERLAWGAFRPAELRGVSGATLLAAGYAAAWWLAPGRAAASAIVVTAVADPAAATAGRLAVPAGTAKTWTGTLAAFGAAVLVLAALGYGIPAVFLGAAAAAAAERAPWRGADNVAVPLLTAAALELVA